MSAVELRLVALLFLFFALVTVAHAAEPVWFDTVAPLRGLTADQQHALADYAWTAVKANPAHPAAFPSDLASDTQPRIVFLSLSDGMTRADTRLGAGAGLKAAIDDAVRWSARDHLHWLRLDIVDESALMAPIVLSMLPGWDRTRHGLAAGRDDPFALLPQHILANRLIDAKRTLQLPRIAAFLGREPRNFSLSELVTYRFTTTSIFRDEAAWSPLVAGHRPFAPGLPEDYRAAARRSGAYLAASQNADGKFTCIYHPDLNVCPEEYNIVHDAAAAYAMMQLYALDHDQAIRTAAEKALDHLASVVVPFEHDGVKFSVVPDGQDADLGANAMTILAAAEHVRTTGDKRYLPLAQKLAELLPALLGETGRFKFHKANLSDGQPTSFQSSSYPGQAIFALCRLYGADKDLRWRDAAARAALFAIRDQEAQPIRLVADHWLLYGLCELQSIQPNRDYPLHAMRIAQVCMAGQHIAPPALDWRGGFGDPPGSYLAATRAEGLCAAYLMLRDIDAQVIEQFRAAARLAADFCLRTQIRPEQAMFYADPARALGGVSLQLDSPEVRIDHQQHAISAWLQAAQISNEPSP